MNERLPFACVVVAVGVVVAVASTAVGTAGGISWVTEFRGEGGDGDGLHCACDVKELQGERWRSSGDDGPGAHAEQRELFFGFAAAVAT